MKKRKSFTREFNQVYLSIFLALVMISVITGGLGYVFSINVLMGVSIGFFTTISIILFGVYLSEVTSLEIFLKKSGVKTVNSYQDLLAIDCPDYFFCPVQSPLRLSKALDTKDSKYFGTIDKVTSQRVVFSTIGSYGQLIRQEVFHYPFFLFYKRKDGGVVMSLDEQKEHVLFLEAQQQYKALTETDTPKLV